MVENIQAAGYDGDFTVVSYMIGFIFAKFLCSVITHGYKGAFNNYVDKKKGRGGQPKVHAYPPRGEGVT